MKKLAFAIVLSACYQPEPKAPEVPVCRLISEPEDALATWQCTLDGKTYVCTRFIDYKCWEVLQ